MKAKKGFFMIAVLLTLQSFGQVAVSPNIKKIKENKEKYIYEFTLPENYTAQRVLQKQKSKEFYFTIDFDEKTHHIVFHLTKKVKITESGLVMIRYLMALGIKQIKVENNDLMLMDFNKMYIRM